MSSAPDAGPDWTIPADAVSLSDYERHARARLPAGDWAYLSGAAADGLTVRRNREAFDRLTLMPRVLADMRGAMTATTLLGFDLPVPILVAPTAWHRLAHPDGEAATVLGAGAVGIPVSISTQASQTIESIAASAVSPLIFQLYMQVSREATLLLIRRAEAAGCRALTLTVDAPVTGLRNEEQRAGFVLPKGIASANLHGVPQPSSRAGPGESPVFRGLLDHAPRWEDVAWLSRATSLPVILKGILSPQDALMAIEHGVAGIVVSNHGGRGLDGVPATIEALPAIASAVSRRVPILLDGGIRRGTDIVKALALGASAVMIGRPVLHGLAVGGAAGVAHVLALLTAELEVAMALLGRPSIDAIDRTVFWQPPAATGTGPGW